MSPRTVVVGGGVAGLATAALLATEGHSVTLFDRGQRLGGRAGLLAEQGFRFDTGPSWYLMPRVFDHFFALLGTSTAAELDLRLLDPGYRVFREPAANAAAQMVAVPHGQAAVRALFEQLEPGSGPAFDTYLASARECADQAERLFLYNPFTRPASLLHPEVMTDLPRLGRLLFGNLRDHIAARFTHPVLRQILGYPAVFLGAQPATAPAMFHLMSALDLDDGVRYPMGGFAGLVDVLVTLAERAGARLVTCAEVTAITTTGHGRGRKATGITWRDRDGALHQEQADVVVSAADLHHTETALLPPAARSRSPRWWRRRVSGPGAVLVMLGVRGELPELAHHSLFFTRDWDANFDAIFGRRPHIPDPVSIYVCRPSATDPGVAPAGHENLFVLIPVPADVGIGHGGSQRQGDPRVENAADAAIDQIAAWAGIDDLRDRIVVRHTRGPADFATDFSSWRGGMLGPAHLLSQSAMFRAQNASRTVKGLYFAGGSVAPGIGVPMCLISAELVLKRVRGDHSAGPLVPPSVPVADQLRSVR